MNLKGVGLAVAALGALAAGAEAVVTLPADVADRCETWLCAGQSNMQQGWGFYNETPAEKARVAQELAQLGEVDVRFWDFNDGSWTKLTPTSPVALEKCANGISFAIRRAKGVRRPICLLYVAAGGAPTEAFLSRRVMCALGPDGTPRYPTLRRIALNPNALEANADFPCLWCKCEYPKRKGAATEAAWWPVARMYDEGIRRIEHLPLTGVYWYQGESNATRNVAPDAPLAEDYMLETNLAIIEQLRGDREIPFVMMGLPKMNRPWAPYRAAQRKACERLGAIYVDSFAAGLGDAGNVHPRNKIPFAELVAKAVSENVPPRTNVRNAPFAREFIEWQDLWVENANAQTSKCARIILFGDSISRQYRGSVSRRLKGKALLVNSASSRCVGDPALLAETRYALSLYAYDVIHFNNGLHGGSLKDDDFAAAFREWIDLMRALQPQAKFVWASITHTTNAFDARVVRRNAEALAVVKSYGDIAIDDLGALTRTHPDYVGGDHVHLTNKGTEAAAAAVAASILKAIGRDAR